MSFEIRYIAQFEREMKRLSKKHHSLKADLLLLIESLRENPFQGDGLGKNCYKVRMKITSKGSGKSGGSRVITCVKVIDNRVFLMSIYDKSEQSDISDSLLQQILKENGLI